MEPGQGEERRSEKIRADGDAVGVEPGVLGDLANKENGAQTDTRQPPGEEAALIVLRQPSLRQIDGPAAGEQKQAEQERARHVQVMRPRPRTPRSIFEERHDQRAEEGDLAENERGDAY